MTLGDNSEGGAIFAFYYAYSGDYDALGITTLNNSIVAGNMSVDSDADDILSETATVANGVNIVGSGSDTDASDGIINANAVDVFATVAGNAADSSMLSGVLADNGGDVQTVALLASASNPALDVVDAPADLLTDAIGNPREVDLADIDNGGIADLGALELQTLADDADEPDLEVSFDADSGTLTVVATEENDSIVISLFSNGTVQLGSELTSFDGTSIQQIDVSGLGGADQIDLSDVRTDCLLYTSPSPRDQRGSRMPSSA